MKENKPGYIGGLGRRNDYITIFKRKGNNLKRKRKNSLNFKVRKNKTEWKLTHRVLRRTNV